jgi:hypothetical protein
MELDGSDERMRTGAKITAPLDEGMRSRPINFGRPTFARHKYRRGAASLTQFQARALEALIFVKNRKQDYQALAD